MSTDDGGAPSEEDVMRTVVEGPYWALTAPAARLFRLLGLHPGPDFGLHSAAVVADLNTGMARQLLDDLVSANLLEQTAPDRYQLHDLLRAYATDQAQAEETPEEREAALRRLLTWCLHTADAAQEWISPGEDHLLLPPATGPVAPLTFADYDAAVDWTERELPTYPRLVAAAATAGQDRLAWQLVETLWQAWPPSAPGVGWLDLGTTGLASAERDPDPLARIRILISLGTVYRAVNRRADGMRSLTAALELCRSTGNRLDEANALNLIGLLHLRARELDRAAAAFEAVAPLFRAEDRPHWAASAVANTATTHLNAGRLPEAGSAATQALAAHRALGNPAGAGNALRVHAAVHREEGDFEAARKAIDEAMDIALALRDHTREAYWLLTLGDVQRATVAYGDALASYQRSAMLHRRLGDRSREALAWRGTGLAYAATGRDGEAAGFLRQAAAAHRTLGDAWEEATDLDHLTRLDPEGADGHRDRVLELIAPFDDPRAEALRDRT